MVLLVASLFVITITIFLILIYGGVFDCITLVLQMVGFNPRRYFQLQNLTFIQFTLATTTTKVYFDLEFVNVLAVLLAQ